MEEGVNGLLSKLAEAKRTRCEPLLVALCEELCTLLCIGTEDILRGIDGTEFVSTLSGVLLLDTCIPEVKVFAMRGLALILDLVPTAGTPAIAQDVVSLAINQLSQPDTTVPYAEELLKALEALSLEHPSAIMKEGRLKTLLSWVEGIEVVKERLLTRILALSILTNVSSRLRVGDWGEVEAVLPLLSGAARSVLEYDAESTAERDEVDTTVSRICLILAHIVDRLGDADAVFEAIGNSTLIAAMLSALSPAAGRRSLSPSQRSFILRVFSVLYTANPSQALTMFVKHEVFHCVYTLLGGFCSLHSEQAGVVMLTEEEEARMGVSVSNGPFLAEEASVCGVIDFLLFILPALPQNALIEPDVLVPFHAWTWEDEFRCFSVFDDVVCHQVEAEYSRQRTAGTLKCVDVMILGRSYTLRFTEMRKENRAARVNCPLYRDPVPGHFARCRIRPPAPSTPISLSTPAETMVDPDPQPQIESPTGRPTTTNTLFRGNRVHPIDVDLPPPSLPPPPEEVDPERRVSMRGLEAAGGSERDRRSRFSASHSSLSSRGGRGVGRFFRRLSCCCGGEDSDDSDASSGYSDRKVIDSGPGPEHNHSAADFIQELRAASLAEERDASAASPQFLGDLLGNVLPALIRLLRTTVNPYLIRDSCLAIGRVLNTAVALMGKEEGASPLSPPPSPAPPSADFTTHRVALLGVAKDLAFTLVLVVNTSSDFCPLAAEVAGRGGGGGGGGEAGYSLYGLTLCAALLSIDMLLQLDGAAFSEVFLRHGVDEAFAKVNSLPDLMQKRGNVGHRGGTANNDAASSSSSTQNNSNTQGKRLLDSILAFTAGLEGRLVAQKPVVVLPEQTVVEKEDVTNRSPEQFTSSMSSRSSASMRSKAGAEPDNTAETPRMVSTASPSQSSAAVFTTPIWSPNTSSATTVLAGLSSFPNIDPSQSPVLLQTLLALVESNKVTSHELMGNNAVALRFLLVQLRGVKTKGGGMRVGGGSSVALSRRSSSVASSLSGSEVRGAVPVGDIEVPQYHAATVKALAEAVDACCAQYIAQAAPDPSFFKALLNAKAQHGGVAGAVGAPLSSSTPAAPSTVPTSSTHSGAFPQRFTLAASHYPLGMTLTASLQCASILNVIQERMSRPLSVRCIYVDKDNGEEETAFTVSVYPFATFACLERWIVARREERGGRRQSGRETASVPQEETGTTITATTATTVAAVAATIPTAISRVSSSQTSESSASSSPVAAGYQARNDVLGSFAGRTAPTRLPPIEDEEKRVETIQTKSVASTQSYASHAAHIGSRDSGATVSNKADAASVSQSVVASVAPQSSQTGHVSVAPCGASETSIASSEAPAPSSPKEVKKPALLEPPTSHHAERGSTLEVSSNGVGARSSFGANTSAGAAPLVATPELHASCPVQLPTRVVSPMNSPVALGLPGPTQGPSNLTLAVQATSSHLHPGGAGAAPSVSSTSANVGGSARERTSDGDNLAPMLQPVSGRLSQISSSGAVPSAAVPVEAATTNTASLAAAATDRTDRASVASRSSMAHTRATAASSPEDEIERIALHTEPSVPLQFSVDGNIVPTGRMSLLDAAVLYSHQGSSMRRILGQCCSDADRSAGGRPEERGERPSRTSSKVLISKALTLWNGNITVQVKKRPSGGEVAKNPIFSGPSDAEAIRTTSASAAKRFAAPFLSDPDEEDVTYSTPPPTTPTDSRRERRSSRERDSNTAMATGVSSLLRGFGGGVTSQNEVRIHETLDLCLSLKAALIPLVDESLHDQRLSAAAIHDLHLNSVPAALPSLAPLAEVATDPRRWTRTMMQRLPQLFPLALRMQHFNSLVTGARLSLLRNIHTPMSSMAWGANNNPTWGSSANRSVVGVQWLRSSGTMWTRAANKRQKVVVSRSHVLHCAEVLFQRHATSPLPLDVFFDKEPGTGLGPTTEFFTLVSRAVQLKSLNLWRSSSGEGLYVNAAHGLFPDILVRLAPGMRQRVLQRFVLVGRLIGRALKEGKTLDIHLNPVLIERILGNDVLRNASANLGLVEHDYERSLQQIASLASSSLGAEGVGGGAEGDEELDVIACLGLVFTLPGHDDICLVPGGDSMPVTLANHKQYLDLVRCTFLHTGIEAQVCEMLQKKKEVEGDP